VPTRADPEQLVRPFRSILFGDRDADDTIDDRPAPACFHDLNLDQIVAAITGAKADYRLTGYFHTPLTDVAAITYRQDVFRDLERGEVLTVVKAFAAEMRGMREKLARAAKAHYRQQKQRWFLDAAAQYCAAVAALSTELADAETRSTGLLAAGDYLAGYVGSEPFRRLRDEGDAVRRGLDGIRYDVLIRGSKITVAAYDDEPDYSEQVLATFLRFRQGEVAERRVKIREHEDMDHIEAGVLELVAQVYTAEFAALDTFCTAHAQFVDSVVGTLDRELQFYVGYLAHIARLRAAGLEITYPELSADDKQETATDTFDLALAGQLVPDQKDVVCNDVTLTDPERILVITGPNNGGKTTLARTIGQLHYLARLGCPVPGRDVRLFVCDEIFTHFEKEEDITTLAGKLQDELNRLHDIFRHATPRSLVIMNEMFNSTTPHDALYLSTEMLNRVTALDALGVCVTFLDDLATLNDKTVSMVSTVVPDDPATRTYKVVRRVADGRAYARALAEKYGLTYDALQRRVSR
jgi:DNA mismatch repair protein MutS